MKKVIKIAKEVKEPALEEPREVAIEREEEERAENEAGRN